MFDYICVHSLHVFVLYHYLVPDWLVHICSYKLKLLNWLNFLWLTVKLKF